MRINIDRQNKGDVESLLRELSHMGEIKNKVFVTFGKVIGNTPACMTISEFDAQKSSMLDMLETYGFKRSLRQALIRGRLIPCGAITDSMFVISPAGDLYRCMETIGDPQYCIGNISDNSKDYHNPVAEKYHPPSRCDSCNKQLLCNAEICPLHYSKEGGSVYFTRENHRECGQNKAYYGKVSG